MYYSYYNTHDGEVNVIIDDLGTDQHNSLLQVFYILTTQEMRTLLGTVTTGQKGQTRAPASTCDVDVREETRESVKCFFTDL